MDELEKGLAIAITGSIRDRALQNFYKRISNWHVALPSVEPLVLDFGLGKFEEFDLIECWLANEAEADSCQVGHFPRYSISCA